MNVQRLDEWGAPGYIARPNSPCPILVQGRHSCEAVEERRLMNVRCIGGMAAPAGVIRPGGPSP